MPWHNTHITSLSKGVSNMTKRHYDRHIQYTTQPLETPTHDCPQSHQYLVMHPDTYAKRQMHGHQDAQELA